jgi:holo-[acyl-carrier protein] synthase
VITGIGVDIVITSRIARLLQKFGPKFEQRFFAPQEIATARGDLAAYYAKRFAAKEAFLKALGSGMRAGLSFCEIAIINDTLGKPLIGLLGGTALFFERHGGGNIFLSLSDDGGQAIAFVVIDRV